MSYQVRDCKVLLDSSVLLQVYEGVDVVDLMYEEVGKCSYYVLDSVVNELSRISLSSKGPKGRAARLALDYIQRRNVAVISTESLKASGDEAILNFFRRNPYFRDEFVVATNDDNLKKELLRLGVKVITWWFGRFKYVVLENRDGHHRV